MSPTLIGDTAEKSLEMDSKVPVPQDSQHTEGEGSHRSPAGGVKTMQNNSKTSKASARGKRGIRNFFPSVQQDSATHRDQASNQNPKKQDKELEASMKSGWLVDDTEFGGFEGLGNEKGVNDRKLPPTIDNNNN